MRAHARGTRVWQKPAQRDSKGLGGFGARVKSCKAGRREPKDSRLIVRLAPPNRFLLALVCATIVLVSGCRKPVESKPVVTIDFEISPHPVRVGSAALTLRLKDSSGKPIIGARIALEADMSHAGMSPVFSETKEVGMGQYQGRLEFAMGGDWVVLVHVTLADGQKFDRQENVPGVEAN